MTQTATAPATQPQPQQVSPLQRAVASEEQVRFMAAQIDYLLARLVARGMECEQLRSTADDLGARLASLEELIATVAEADETPAGESPEPIDPADETAQDAT